MLELTLGRSIAQPLTILCIGAHSDDVEIGCGGTIRRLLVEHPGSTVHWIVCSATGQRELEARSSATAFCADAENLHVTVHAYRESHFPYVEAEIKTSFEALKPIEPDIIFTHVPDDLHQDHSTLGRLAWNTFRDHLIAGFEIPKYEGDLGRPNMYAPLTREQAEDKVRLILENFQSQLSRPWFRTQTFEGLMAIRGVECNASSGYAEAFISRKFVI